MKFTLVIPSVNTVDLVKNCLDSYRRFHEGEDHEIVVVDDGSDETTRNLLRTYVEGIGGKFLFNEVNSGFIKTVNKGMRAGTGDNFILVNNDIVFTQNVTKKFKESFEADEKIGIVDVNEFANSLAQQSIPDIVMTFSYYADKAMSVVDDEFLNSMTRRIVTLIVYLQQTQFDTHPSSYCNNLQ